MKQLTPHWATYSFSNLPVHTLYKCLKLRQDVFVLEQNCLYPELDDQDQAAQHLIGYHNEHLIAYARVIREEDAPRPIVKIGRIVVHPLKRKQGLGKELVMRCLKFIHQWQPNASIEIAAQAQLTGFYRQFGFQPVGTCFDDAGILHQSMTLSND